MTKLTFASSLPSGRRPYPLVLNLGGGFKPNQQSIILAAANAWATRIRGGDRPVYFDQNVHDGLEIDVSVGIIDGAKSKLGMAGPTVYRPGFGLPVQAMLEFDIADLKSLTVARQLDEVASHEIAHCLGFGMDIWDQKRLIRTTGPKRWFTGVEASRVYGQNVPMQDVHWREADLRDELMTPLLDNPAPLTKVTLASLVDTGYDIDLTSTSMRMPVRIGSETADSSEPISLDFDRPVARVLPDFTYVPDENLGPSPDRFTHTTAAVTPFRWSVENPTPVGELGPELQLRITDEDSRYTYATDERGLKVVIERRFDPQLAPV